MNTEEIKKEVQSHYASIAVGINSGCCGGLSGCCSIGAASDERLQIALEYSEGDLGLGCGLPTYFAGLEAGKTVLDLGSGAGSDVFRAAKAVGPDGWVIGVDLTPEMVARAWNHAVSGGYQNVEFRLGDIENLPISDETVDVVISNCVINLVPNKRRVFAEIRRTLKPGGRFSVSDIVTYGPVPESIRQDMALWAGCVAGAMDKEEYLQIIRDQGFANTRIHQLFEYDMFKGENYGIASITIEASKV